MEYKNKQAIDFLEIFKFYDNILITIPSSIFFSHWVALSKYIQQNANKNGILNYI